MAFKTFAVVSTLTLTLAGAALAQSNTAGGSGNSTNSTATGAPGSISPHAATTGNPTTAGTLQGAATKSTGNNDNGTMSGNPTSSGSGTPTNSGAVGR